MPTPVELIDKKAEPQNAAEDESLYNSYKINKFRPAKEELSQIKSKKSMQESDQLYGAAAGAAQMNNSYYARESRSSSPSLHSFVTHDEIGPIMTNESYDTITENSFHQCLKEPLSTFSIDVDTASY